MAEIINLRQARKKKKRTGKETVAAENRAKFGQKRSVKKSAAFDTKKLSDSVDGAKLETPDEKKP